MNQIMAPKKTVRDNLGGFIVDDSECSQCSSSESEPEAVFTDSESDVEISKQREPICCNGNIALNLLVFYACLIVIVMVITYFDADWLDKFMTLTKEYQG